MQVYKPKKLLLSRVYRSTELPTVGRLCLLLLHQAGGAASPRKPRQLSLSQMPVPAVISQDVPFCPTYNLPATTLPCGRFMTGLFTAWQCPRPLLPTESTYCFLGLASQCSEPSCSRVELLNSLFYSIIETASLYTLPGWFGTCLCRTGCS